MQTQSTLARTQAVSRAFCVHPFDRSQFPAELNGDTTHMSSEQKKWDIHYTDVAYDERFSHIWCGCTSFAGDLLWTFDPKSMQFESKGFADLREEYEVKIHRGMEFAPDGNLYFGTAGLITIKQRATAPGGRLFRYDPLREEFEFLGRPVEHDYIQNIAVDYDRGLIYGTTYPCAQFFVWDMAKKKTIKQVFIDHLPHMVCIDDNGTCWSSYRKIPMRNYYRMFSYNPGDNEVTWTDVPVPGEHADNDAMIDGFVNGNDGFLYASLYTGSLLRFDPQSTRFEMITRPASSRGFGALSRPVDGKLYGVAGSEDTTQIISYDLATGDIERFGSVYDEQRKTSIFRPHELVMGPNRCLYCPETDHEHRQCYFWEIQLP